MHAIMHRKDVIPTTITSASLPAKKRILTVCVKLFLEQGYKKTTVSEIVHKASVSNSIFQNIFRAKDGVLTELVEFMFSNQFAMARTTAGAQLPPVYVYAVETAIQMTLTELNENLREIYIEAYTQKEASDYIFQETAKELYQIFGPYQPELTARDFYAMEIGSAGIMRSYMAHPCDGELTLEKKLRMFLTMSLRAYRVPEAEVEGFKKAAAQAQADAAAEEAKATRAKAREDAQEDVRRLKEEAKAQAAKILTDAQAAAESSRRKVMEETQHQVKELVSAAAEKLVLSSDSAAFDQFLELAGKGEDGDAS